MDEKYLLVIIIHHQILLFQVELQDNSYSCCLLGKFRNHVAPITDLASSNTKIGKVRCVAPISNIADDCFRFWPAEIVLVL